MKKRTLWVLGCGLALTVAGTLLSGDWGEASAEARADALADQLSGQGGDPYAVMSLSGHATHYQLGVPGEDPFDIRGLDANRLGDLDLAGRVIYAVGCHSGLPVLAT